MGGVFAFDVEFFAADGADGAVREIEGEFWGGIFAEVVVVFELVKVFGGRDGVVSCVVALEDAGAGFAFEGTGYQWFRGRMVLVRE